MDRKFYLDLAASGLCIPIATDLVLHEHADHNRILTDGTRLGAVIKETAERFGSPLAFPLMDLSLEKTALLSMLGVPADQIGTYHMTAPPTDRQMRQVRRRLGGAYDPRLSAQLDAITWISSNTSLVPVGITIGPFSLMTKLVADPITPLYLAASGALGAYDPELQMIERCLELATQVILRSLNAQILAGAEMVFVAEPAANVAYISPNQIEAGSDVFDRFVMKCNQRLRSTMRAWDVDLLFHCCGEVTPYMIRKFCELDPAMLSLGSGRKLWEDAQVVPQSTVLYGNLPSKRFYSDDLMPLAEVRQAARDLKGRMAETGHPFILGSECDILCVPGHEDTIMAKAAGMVQAVGGNDEEAMALLACARPGCGHGQAAAS